LEAKTLKMLHERIVKSFMDMLILAELINGPLSGYDVVMFIHKKFHLLVSSGTVYSLLYSMERDGLIRGRWTARRRVYTLTEKGGETIKDIINLNDQIQYFLLTLFKGYKRVPLSIPVGE